MLIPPGGFHDAKDYLTSKTRLVDGCNQLINEFEARLEATFQAAPVRTAYAIERSDVGAVQLNSDFEIRMERAIWSKHRIGSNESCDLLAPECTRIASYSLGLFDGRIQNGWGEIDLVGVDAKHQPVVIELKQESGVNPLAMIVQGLAYAIALQNNWENFFPSWNQVVENAPKHVPTNWLVIGLAPSGYWARFDAKLSELNRRNWDAINSFVNRAKLSGFDLRFAAFVVKDNGELLPDIGACRWLESQETITEDSRINVPKKLHDADPVNEPTSRLIAIGDVHGCSRTLEELLLRIMPTSTDMLIFLGDLVNRGPDTRGVLKLVIDLGARCKVVCILGNHEEVMLDARFDSNAQGRWESQGGFETMMSYGSRGSINDIPDDHWDFIGTFVPYFETDRFIFTHANYNWYTPMNEQPSSLLRWTSIEDDPPQAHISGKKVIVGHSPGSMRDLGFCMCVDTGCGLGGALTAIELNHGTIWTIEQSPK